jgi:hypothetical protein
MFATIVFEEGIVKLTPLSLDERLLEVAYPPEPHLRTIKTIFREGDTVWVEPFTVDENEGVFICNELLYFWSLNDPDIIPGSGDVQFVFDKGRPESVLKRLVEDSSKKWKNFNAQLHTAHSRQK